MMNTIVAAPKNTPPAASNPIFAPAVVTNMLPIESADEMKPKDTGMSRLFVILFSQELLVYILPKYLALVNDHIVNRIVNGKIWTNKTSTAIVITAM